MRRRSLSRGSEGNRGSSGEGSIPPRVFEQCDRDLARVDNLQPIAADPYSDYYSSPIRVDHLEDFGAHHVLVINGCRLGKGKRSERKCRQPSSQKRREESGQSKQRGPVDSQRVRPGPEGLNRCRNLQTAPSYSAEKKHQISTLEETHVNVPEGRFLFEQIVLMKSDCFSTSIRGFSRERKLVGKH